MESLRPESYSPPMRFVVVAVAGILVSLPAQAMDKGDVCTLKAALLVTINTPDGKIETALDPGTDVELVVVGDEGRSRINTGDAKASVATRDLEAACAGTLQLCRLKDELLLFEKNRSDSRSWKIKRGAPVSVLRSGKVWAHLRVDDLEGFAKADDLKTRCPLDAGGRIKDDAEPITDEVERGEGPGVLFLPLLLEGAAPAGVADQLAEGFFERLTVYRPDAGRLASEGDRSSTGAAAWKKHVADSAARARRAGLAYVVVGKVGIEAATVAPGGAAAGGGGGANLVVSVAVVDSQNGLTLKAVRTRPLTAANKPVEGWADQLLASLLPPLRAAPGGRLPAPPKTGTKPTSTTTPEQPLTVREASATPAAAPWFANPWGYVTLGGAVAAGVGSGVVGALANTDNTAANDTPPVDDQRSALRSQALGKAVASDALAVTAAVATVATVVVFAGRVGMAE